MAAPAVPASPDKMEKKPPGHAGAEEQPPEPPRPIVNRKETFRSRFVNFDSQWPGPDDASRQAGKANAHRLAYGNQKAIAVFDFVAAARFHRDHSRESNASPIKNNAG
jgi:hypothetical protein